MARMHNTTIFTSAYRCDGKQADKKAVICGALFDLSWGGLWNFYRVATVKRDHGCAVCVHFPGKRNVERNVPWRCPDSSG